MGRLLSARATFESVEECFLESRIAASIALDVELLAYKGVQS